jgi:3-oxoadipate enol-lactonase
MDIVPMHYRLDGKGQNLLLLHPVGLDLTFFDDLVEELKPYYRVLRVDLRGHGDTPLAQAGTAPKLKDYARDVHAMLQELKFTRTIAIGFSFGGIIAQELALDYPDDVCALVISACASTFSQDTRTAMRERGSVAEREGMQALIDATMHRWFSTEFQKRGADAPVKQRLLTDDVESWKQAWLAISELDTAPRLPAIKVPTLCLAGERDLSAPPEVVKNIAKLIPGATFDAIPNAPHMLFIEYPSRTATAIMRFLRKAAVGC